MKIGVILPASDLAGPDSTPGWPTIRDFALRAEERGLDSVWMIDHFFHESPDGARAGMHEAWTIVSAVAAVTSRVEIGTLVMCTAFRNPGLLAKMAATAQEISGGRLILGLGAGWHRAEFDAFGYPFDHRVTRFAEALPTIVTLLRGQPVTSGSSRPPLRGASLIPPPSYDVPVVVAADGPRMLGLTASHADGWNTAWYGAPDAGLRERLAAMDQALDAEGRDRASLTRTVAIYVYDPASGEGPDPGEPAVVGRDALVRALDEYEALGIDHVIVQPLPHVTATLDLVADAIAQRGAGGPAER